jgi:hypothetical protein
MGTGRWFNLLYSKKKKNGIHSFRLSVLGLFENGYTKFSNLTHPLDISSTKQKTERKIKLIFAKLQSNKVKE